MDARGFVSITGRLREMIIRGGENVYPREVENLLLEHPAISAVAVIGLPHPFWGEQVAAVVVPSSAGSPPSAEELLDFVHCNLAAYKAPSAWFFTDSFPFTDTGKLQKFKLVEAISEGLLTCAPAALAGRV